MSQWYYAHGGKQFGPMDFEVLVDLASKGGLDPVNDLAWTASMKDWLPAGQIPGLFGMPAKRATPQGDPANPYAAPGSAWTAPDQVPTGEALAEIIPGSQILSSRGCVKRAFDLVMRNFGMLLLIGIVYLVCSSVMNAFLHHLDSALGLPRISRFEYVNSNGVRFYFGSSGQNPNGSWLNVLISNVFSTFLALGFSKIALNLVSGKPFTIGMLFSGGNLLLPGCVATLLFGLMVGVGLVLFIVPGIYLALRYGQFMLAMVDKNLGVMDSFQYSASITTNNKMKLFFLALLAILVILAGFLVLVIGLVVAIPVVSLSSMPLGKKFEKL
jgi:uncharacterized membrane protein